MGNRKTPFVSGEWYHCYSRGIDKCATFLDENDYRYFLESAHMANRRTKLPKAQRKELSSQEIWELPVDDPLVVIRAYCLMPNHFHLLIQEVVEDGISTFMQRLGTAYSMYFNKKYERSGGLFTSPFRSKHIPDDRYLRQVIRYIHDNPLSLLDTGASKKVAQKHLGKYRFSSLLDYRKRNRPERFLLKLK